MTDDQPKIKYADVLRARCTIKKHYQAKVPIEEFLDTEDGPLAERGGMMNTESLDMLYAIVDAAGFNGDVVKAHIYAQAARIKELEARYEKLLQAGVAWVEYGGESCPDDGCVEHADCRLFAIIQESRA